MTETRAQKIRAAAITSVPRACADLPGTGGTLKTIAEDFEVEEIPAYAPSGSGDHLYLWLEKTDLPAMQLTAWVSRALQVNPRDIGCAGLKDARAVTRQYLSVPKSCEPRLKELEGDSKVRLLHVQAHTNKLKTGHLQGNRFIIRLRGVAPGSLGAAQQVLGRLSQDGLPNAYGPQRFGHEGHTALLGAEMLGLLPPGRGRIGRSTQRLALSALQSAVFNACLRQRMQQGLMNTPLVGDVMQVRASGGPFVVEDVARETPRLRAHEVVLTGPMPGPKMRAATGEALDLETAVLHSMELEWAHFAVANKLMQGTRRAFLVWPSETQVQEEAADVLKVQFTLPKGAFATCVLHEMMG